MKNKWRKDPAKRIAIANIIALTCSTLAIVISILAIILRSCA